MIIMLAIGSKVRGFKPAKDDGNTNKVQIHNTTFFGGEVKPLAPCLKILLHVKDPCGV
jgi:hypothetical protein